MNQMIKIIDDKNLMINGRKYRNLKKLGEGKSADSYLYEEINGDGLVTVKKYAEKESATIPFSRALEFETVSFERMKESEIPVPEMIGFSQEEYILIKEYILGTSVIEMVAEGKLTDRHFSKIFEIAGKLKNHGYHVDFFPANFIDDGNELFCIDYEAHPYLEEWNFENWGIYYWLNTEGIRQFLNTGNPDFMNRHGEPKPLTEGLERERQRLMNQFYR